MAQIVREYRQKQPRAGYGPIWWHLGDDKKMYPSRAALLAFLKTLDAEQQPMASVQKLRGTAPKVRR
jgi:hypothetical protein